MKSYLVKVYAAILVVAVAGALLFNPVAGAQISDGANSAKGEGVANELKPGEIVSNTIDAILWGVGILSVVMLIWGGIKYITSAGDANKVTSAKNTILYAVIGLVIAIFAYAIVSFVNTTGQKAGSAAEDTSQSQ